MSRPGRSTTVKTLRLPSQMLQVCAGWDSSSFVGSEPGGSTAMDGGVGWLRIFFPQALRVNMTSRVDCFTDTCMT